MVAYIVYTGGCEKHESRELKIHVGGMELANIVPSIFHTNLITALHYAFITSDKGRLRLPYVSEQITIFSYCIFKS